MSVCSKTLSHLTSHQHQSVRPASDFERVAPAFPDSVGLYALEGIHIHIQKGLPLSKLPFPSTYLFHWTASALELLFQSFKQSWRSASAFSASLPQSSLAQALSTASVSSLSSSSQISKTLWSIHQQYSICLCRSQVDAASKAFHPKPCADLIHPHWHNTFRLDDCFIPQFHLPAQVRSHHGLGATLGL